MTTNYYKVEQLTEENQTSTTFVDIPGTTLTFTPAYTTDIWMIFASGVCRSSSTIEESFEITLNIGGAERDLWSHQNNDAGTPNGAGFLIFDRITGTTLLQTVKLQFRAIAGTVYAKDIRVVAARVPSAADFQYFNSDANDQVTGVNLNVGQLAFTPTSTGNYYIIGSVKHREFPGGSTSQAWFEGSDASEHPNAPAAVHHSNARDAWNPTTYIWRQNLAASLQTFIIRFTSSASGAEASQTLYRKLMIFREDAWDVANYDLAAAETTTTSGTFQTKNSVTTTAPPIAQDYLTIQTARISGDTVTATVQKAGELRAGGSALVRTDHHIDRDGSSTQGYHHTIGVADVRNTVSSVTYANGFLSPNAATIQCAESAIVVLRYIPDQTHQMLL